MRIGKVTDSILKRSVLKLIKNKNNNNRKGAAAMVDCALSIDSAGVGTGSAISTFTASAKHGGYYAVHNAANNLFCCKVEPQMVVLNIMLSPETEESELKTIMRDCKKATEELGLEIKGGHTETTDALTRPLISAVAVGKTMDRFCNFSKERPAPDSAKKAAEVSTMAALGQGEKTGSDNSGKAIIMTGYAALEGTAILSEELTDKLTDRFPAPLVREAADFKNSISVRDAAEIAMEKGAETVHDISGGGVFAALWELSEIAGCGFNIDLKAIPLRQETIEITNFLGLNPYQMLSGGSLLFISDKENEVLKALMDRGINAAVIGRCDKSNDKIICNEDEKRYLDKPASDEILKLNEIRERLQG